MDPITLVIVLVVAVVLLIVAIKVIGFAFSILWALLVGLAIGALARAILPGRQELGYLATALSGVAGSIGGKLLASGVFGLRGFFVTLLFEVACAVGVVAVVASRRKRLR